MKYSINHPSHFDSFEIAFLQGTTLYLITLVTEVLGIMYLATMTSTTDIGFTELFSDRFLPFRRIATLLSLSLWSRGKAFVSDKLKSYDLVQ